MTMEFKDYYKVLGVERTADKQAISRAFRKLARQHHPDVNPGNAQAEARFKEVNEAYQVLSDPERRAKYDQLLDLRSARAHTRSDHLAELQPRCTLRDGLEVVRVVVLAVDEDDLLGAAGDVELALVHEAQVPGAQPAIGAESGGIRLRVLIVAARDVIPGHLHVPDALRGKLPILIVHDAHAAVRDRSPLGHELHGVAVRDTHPLHHASGIHLVSVEGEGAQRRAHFREAHGEGGFGEPVHGVHGVARELRGCETREELVAELDRDRLRAIEDEAHG
jgi:hypothetical protein